MSLLASTMRLLSSMSKFWIEVTMKAVMIVEGEDAYDAEEKYIELRNQGRLTPDHYVHEEDQRVVMQVVDSTPLTPLL